MRPKIMQCHHSGYCRCKGGWNPWIPHVGKMVRALHIQFVNFSVESIAYLPGGPRKINEQAIRVIDVDLQAMRLQPSLDLVAILFCHSKFFAKLFGREPAMEVWRTWVVKFLDEGLKARLRLRRPFQQEQHVLHEKVVVHPPTVVFRLRLRSRIAGESRKVAFVYWLGNLEGTYRFSA